MNRDEEGYVVDQPQLMPAIKTVPKKKKNYNRKNISALVLISIRHPTEMFTPGGINENDTLHKLGDWPH